MVSVQDLLISTLFISCCIAASNSLPQPNLATSLRNNGHLALYPRVGKRYNIPRRDFLNILADKWQRTGSLRGAIHEIQDMTERKRSVDDVEQQRFSSPNQLPPFILLVRRDLNPGFVQPEEPYNDVFYKYPMMRRNYY